MARTMQPTSPSFPERLGRYDLLLPIAHGGMARVYLARMAGPRGFEREVAIKVIHSHLSSPTGGSDASNELLDAARAPAHSRHPNVVPVLDVGEDGDGLFLVMDYIEGDSLAALQVAAGGALPVSIALRILIDALSGLEAAHQLCDKSGRNLGVVHRDFSPQN